MTLFLNVHSRMSKGTDRKFVWEREGEARQILIMRKTVKMMQRR